MATIVTRSGKGSALTWQEGDDNFTNLNNDKIEALADDLTPTLSGNLDVGTNSITTTVTDGDINITANGTGIISLNNDTRIGTGTADAFLTSTGANDLYITTDDGTAEPYIQLQNGANGGILIQPDGTGRITLDAVQWPAGDGTNGQALTTNGAGSLSWTTISSGITDIVQDTTPQLGGNLDVNGNQIVSVSNANIVIAPNGTGIVRADKSVQIQAQGEIRLADSDSSNYVGFKSPATVSSNLIWTLPATDGTSGQVLSTNGTGTLSWATAGGGGSGAAGSVAYLDCIQSATINATTGRVNFTTALVETDPDNLVTTSGASFTLSAGTYIVDVYYDGYFSVVNSINTASYIRNTTDSTDLVTVTWDRNQVTPLTYPTSTISVTSSTNANSNRPRTLRFVLSASKTFTPQYQINAYGGTVVNGAEWKFFLVITKFA